MTFTCECPKHGNSSPSPSIVRGSNQTFTKYFIPMHTLLVQLQSQGHKTNVSQVVNSVGTMFLGTKKAETFFSVYPCLAEVIEDYVPPAPVLIALAERNLGVAVSANTMETVRAEVERIVDTTRISQHNVRLSDIAAPYIVGNNIGGPAADVFTLIREKYVPFTVGIANSNIVIAGRIHELIPSLALESAGLIPGQDFDTPPKKLRLGDIRVHNKAQKAQLATEVKSLAARERFKRGLEEIKGPKVGLGFFNDPTEFTADASSAMINQGVLAVYMPAATLQSLSSPLRQYVNSNQRPFFRPLSQYPQDMHNFVTTGMLP